MSKISLFESNVIYIGTKTAGFKTQKEFMFESNVIYIGTKTRDKGIEAAEEFESNVIYIGTKTIGADGTTIYGLRVM